MVGRESGKTTLVSRYIDGESFTMQNDNSGLFGIGEAPTIEEVREKKTEIDGERCIISLLDITGSAGHEDSKKKWYKMVEGFMIIYSITDKASFDGLKQQIQEILKFTRRKAVPMVIVGNKSIFLYFIS